MICCRELSISVAPVSCTTGMTVDSAVNATQDYPSFSGIPPWAFGSQIASGFPSPTFGSITLKFNSPTLKTWRFNGALFNPGSGPVRGWQVLAFPVAPIITIDGVLQTLTDTLIDGAHFWMLGTDTFDTDACVERTLHVEGTSIYGGLGHNAELVQIESLTP